MKWDEKPYHSLNYEMHRRYGEKVYRLTLNGGMTCPNRDGTLGEGGCSAAQEVPAILPLPFPCPYGRRFRPRRP